MNSVTAINTIIKTAAIITAKRIVKAKNGSIWTECPSGFVCLQSAKGVMYCSKV